MYPPQPDHEAPTPPTHPVVRLMRALVLAFIGLGLLTGSRFFFWLAVALAVPVVLLWARAVGQRRS